MKTYVGSISYYATGEGVHNWVFATNAENEDEFKIRMRRELNIDPYFMIGLEIDNPEVLVKYEKEIAAAKFGMFKQYLGFNMS